MQRTGAFGWKRVIKILIPVLVCIISVVLDQVSKVFFKNLFFENKGETVIIPNFFYFTYTVNTGAAWGFLSEVSWGQLFFKILTSIAILIFAVLWVFSIIKNKKWLSYSFSFIIGGTVGNFIDRLSFNGVTDFIGVYIGTYKFPIFNLADSFLVVGMIMIIVYFLFLDKDALLKFRKKKTGEKYGKKDLSDN